MNATAKPQRKPRYVLCPKFVGIVESGHEERNRRERLMRERYRWFVSYGARGAPSTDPVCDYIEGAEFWEVYSERNFARVSRAFEHQNVGVILYSKTGAIVDTRTKENGYHVFHMQLVRHGDVRDWDLDLCLTEAKIYVQRKID